MDDGTPRTLGGVAELKEELSFSAGEEGATLSAVQDACKNGPEAAKFTALRRIARQTGGFLNDDIRRLAWPELLGCTQDNKTLPKASDQGWRHLLQHKDEGQVRLDVDRSFIYYPNDKTSEEIDRLKADLLEVITSTLRHHPMLCYFQGFHDIVQVLLLVLGKTRALEAVPRLSLLRLRDFMLPSLSSSLTHLELLPAILGAVDPALARHVAGTRPFFALAATLTLFAHEVESYAAIARLFDFLLAEEAVVAVYLFASIVVSRREELLDIPAEEPEMLHFTLSKLPKPFKFEPLIEQAISMMAKHPPERLPFRAWAKLSRHSVLKTTHKAVLQTLEEGERHFQAQLIELEWIERRKKASATMWAYRRPVGGIGVGILIALISIWAQKNGGMALISSLLNRAFSLCKMLLRTSWD